MSIKRIFIAISAIFAASAVFADNSSVTSKKYVDDLMSGYQGKLPGSGANKLMIYDDEDGIGEKAIETTLVSNATSVPTVGAVKTGLDGKQDTITGAPGYVMTGTGYNGSVGEKPIYGTSSHYNSALVTAETVNSGVINAVNSSLIRVDENGDQDPNGTLWEIQDDLVALNICSGYTSVTGNVVQNGTPTPTNPILPTFYQDGDMILRAVGNYADSYDATTNKITRRVGVKVLDGTENWIISTSLLSEMYNLAISNLFAEGVSTTTNRVSPYCSHFKRSANWINYQNRAGYIQAMSNSGGNVIGVGYGKVSYENLPVFKTWLADQYAAGTPVVVYYPLATPVTEDMPPRCQ